MIYAVLAHRGGDRENHTYLVCVCANFPSAKTSAEEHEQYRGGKYSCSIQAVDFGEWSEEMDDKAVKELVAPIPLPGWKTAAERMIDEHRFEKAVLPLLKKVIEVVDDWNNDPTLPPNAPKHPFTNLVEQARKEVEKR